MAQKERELIGELTRAALTAARARGRVLGEDHSHRPPAGPYAAMAAVASRVAADRGAHRLALKVEAIRATDAVSMAEVAAGLNGCGVPKP